MILALSFFIGFFGTLTLVLRNEVCDLRKDNECLKHDYENAMFLVRFGTEEIKLLSKENRSLKMEKDLKEITR